MHIYKFKIHRNNVIFNEIVTKLFTILKKCPLSSLYTISYLKKTFIKWNVIILHH